MVDNEEVGLCGASVASFTMYFITNGADAVGDSLVDQMIPGSESTHL